MELLRAGMGKEGVEAFVRALEIKPDLVSELIDLLTIPSELPPRERKLRTTQAQKASWVIRHIADKNPAILRKHHGALHALLDEVEDESVLRELLKALSEPELRALESQPQTNDLALLGCGFMEADGVSVALAYLGMQLVEDRLGRSSEVSMSDALRSLDNLLSRKSAEDPGAPLMRAAKKRRARWVIKISRERNRQSAAE